MLNRENAYITWRVLKAFIQSIPFYINRLRPINPRKIVFTTIEGTTGFSCNPKYIALELIERNGHLSDNDKFELVWLVNDINKQFPDEIRKVKNTLWNRARELSTAYIWIDNSRKQLECKKRKKQIYIQTWHAKLGFKPTCLDRGKSFSKIAYLVSKHDSDMVDFWLSNSDWYDKTLKTGSLYKGKTIRCGSPRCDILIRARDDMKFKNQVKEKIVKEFAVKEEKNKEIHFIMYAPTFRGGSQGVNRSLDEAGHMPDFKMTIDALEEGFGGKWIILLRLHPQMTVRKITSGIGEEKKEISNRLIDVSEADDMYELLAGCDAFMTDYSSAAFDAAVMESPVFLYCDDYREYENERGKLLWDLRELPFSFAENNEELITRIRKFDANRYKTELQNLFVDAGMIEDGMGSKAMADFVEKRAAF